MIRMHVIAAVFLVGCTRPPNDQPEIVPDLTTSVGASASASVASASAASGAASTGAGGLDEDGAGGHGGAASVSAGTGLMGDGGGPTSASGSRLKVVSYVGVDGSRLTADYAHDSTLGFDCSFQTASDGSTRCFPIPMNATLVYADSGCTTVALSPWSECDIESSPYMSAQYTADACPVYRFRAFRVSNPHVDTAYMVFGGTCSAAGLRHLVDATEVDASDLAGVAVEVDGA